MIFFTLKDQILCGWFLWRIFFNFNLFSGFASNWFVLIHWIWIIGFHCYVWWLFVNRSGNSFPFGCEISFVEGLVFFMWQISSFLVHQLVLSSIYLFDHIFKFLVLYWFGWSESGCFWFLPNMKSYHGLTECYLLCSYMFIFGQRAAWPNSKLPFSVPGDAIWVTEIVPLERGRDCFSGEFCVFYGYFWTSLPILLVCSNHSI